LSNGSLVKISLPFRSSVRGSLVDAGLAESRSRVDSNTFSQNANRSDPTIHQSSVVSDLEARTVDGFDYVRIFVAVHLAQHDVSDRESGTIDGRNSTQLARFDLPFMEAPRG